MTRHRYVQIDGVLHEVGNDYSPEPRSDYHIMKDIAPYRSMVDGSIISSRSRHREHLRDHRLTEVGNETKHLMAKVRPLESPPGLKETIRAVAEQKLRR